MFLLFTVLLRRYSAAGWPGLWPLRPYVVFEATGAPIFSSAVHWGIWDFQPLLHPLPDDCSRWGCIMNGFAILAQFGPTSGLEALSSPSPWPPSSCTKLVSTLVTMAETSLVWLSTPFYPVLCGCCGARVDFIVPRWCEMPSQQVIVSGEGKFAEDIRILCVFHTCLHYFCIACHGP